MNIIINIAIFLISAVIFSFVGYTMRKRIAESKIRVAEEEAKRILCETERNLGHIQSGDQNCSEWKSLQS